MRPPVPLTRTTRSSPHSVQLLWPITTARLAQRLAQQQHRHHLLDAATATAGTISAADKASAPGHTQTQGTKCRDNLPGSGAEASSQPLLLHAQVTGFTTPNVAAVGGASVRLRLLSDTQQQWPQSRPPLLLPDGGYLVALREAGGAAVVDQHTQWKKRRQWLPAIAGVPGERGPDDHGNYRVGLAECMVFGRPVDPGSWNPCTNEQLVAAEDDEEAVKDGATAPAPAEVTVLHEETLRELLPCGATVEVLPLCRVTDFFLGLNAGQWLKLRLQQIAADSRSYLETSCATAELRRTITCKGLCSEPEDELMALLEGTGLVLQRTTRPEPPPPNCAEEHYFYGNFAVPRRRITGDTLDA
jgi:hypothetical protein